MANYRLYEDRGGSPKYAAQQNLMGRTHYVDPDTLSAFRSRILSARAAAGGLLYIVMESASGDCDHKTRIFRGVIFDIAGHIISRPSIDESYKTRRAAAKALEQQLGAIDVVAVTKEAMAREERTFNYERDTVLAHLAKRVQS